MIDCPGGIPALLRSESSDSVRRFEMDQRKCGGTNPKTADVHLQTVGEGSVVAIVKAGKMFRLRKLKIND